MSPEEIIQQAQDDHQQMQQDVEAAQGTFNVVFPIVGGVVGLIFIFALLMIFSSKVRGKLISKHIEAVDIATSESKDSITKISENLGPAVENTTEALAKGIKKGLKD